MAQEQQETNTLATTNNGTSNGVGNTQQGGKNKPQKERKQKAIPKISSKRISISFEGSLELDKIDLSQLPKYAEGCVNDDASGRFIKISDSRIIFAGDTVSTRATFGEVYRLHLPRNAKLAE
jgi:hypothetical protein